MLHPLLPVPDSDGSLSSYPLPFVDGVVESATVSDAQLRSFALFLGGSVTSVLGAVLGGVFGAPQSLNTPAGIGGAAVRLSLSTFKTQSQSTQANVNSLPQQQQQQQQKINLMGSMK